MLGDQTRERGDLDLWMDARTIEPLLVTRSELGIERIRPWPGDRPWNFVLHDGGQLREVVEAYLHDLTLQTKGLSSSLLYNGTRRVE
ncbi:MAG: hypothetical protein WCF36_13170 [Candidatus Nanopelagicales bacterium]